MRIIIAKDEQYLIRRAGELAGEQMENKRNSVLGLAAGSTMVSIFGELARLHRERSLDFSLVVAFNVDEYVGVQHNDPAGIRFRMHDLLFRHINIPGENIHVPDGLAAIPSEECDRYEQSIVQNGGIDWMLLGIGLNGHIGFNEPLTPFGSRTHIARISRTSRLARARLFGSLQRVPRLGMTMGMRTIMHARRILLISKGEGKADIMRRALYGEVTTRIPASVLQLHPELTVLVDPLAARYLPTAGPKPC